MIRLVHVLKSGARWVDAPSVYGPRNLSSLSIRRQRGELNQAIGRSRGGRTTKIHALTDEQCRPIAFMLTGGQMADCTAGAQLLERLPRELPMRQPEMSRLIGSTRARPKFQSETLPNRALGCEDRGYCGRPENPWTWPCSPRPSMQVATSLGAGAMLPYLSIVLRVTLLVMAAAGLPA